MASTDTTAPDSSLAALIPLGSQAKAGAIELKRPITLLGSRKDAVRVHLQSSTVSKAHAAIVLNAWGCYVHDLGSRTGTLVNGKPVIDQDLADGDVIQIGRFQFKYRAPQRTRPKPLPLPAADIAVSTLAGPLQAVRRVIVIGRRAGSDVEFAADSRVSNVHAIVVEQDGRRLVRDLNSRTGTWLDDKPIHQEPLPDFEALKIGGATVTFKPRGTLAGAVHPESALPIPLDEAGPAAGVVLGLDAADDLDLDLLPDTPAGPAAAPADDLAALRRDWKAPALPPQPTPLTATPVRSAPAVPVPAARVPSVPSAPVPAMAVPPAAPVAEARVRPPEPSIRPPVSPAPAAPPVSPVPIELEPLELEPLELDPAAPAAEVPPVVSPVAPPAPAARLAPASETPDVTVPEADVDLLAEPDLDLLTDAPTAEAERDLADEAAVESGPPDLRPEPTAARPLPVAERPDFDVPAEVPADERDLESPAGPAVPSADAGAALAELPAEADDDVLPDELPADALPADELPVVGRDAGGPVAVAEADVVDEPDRVGGEPGVEAVAERERVGDETDIDADEDVDAGGIAVADADRVPDTDVDRVPAAASPAAASPAAASAAAELLMLDDAEATPPTGDALGEFLATSASTDAPAEAADREAAAEIDTADAADETGVAIDAGPAVAFKPGVSPDAAAESADAAAAVADSDATLVELDDAEITPPRAEAEPPAAADGAVPAGLALTPEADAADVAEADAGGVAVAGLADADLTLAEDDEAEAVVADAGRPTPDPDAPAVAEFVGEDDFAVAETPAEPVGLDRPDATVSPAVPVAEAPTVDEPPTLDLDELELDPDPDAPASAGAGVIDADADVVDDDAADRVPHGLQSPVVGLPVAEPAAAGAGPLDSDALDLAEIELDLDADAPAIASGAVADVVAEPPHGLNTPAVVVDEAGPVGGVATPPAVDELDALDLEPLDLSDVELERDPDAPHAGVIADVATPDPDAPGVDSAETLAGVDLVDLAADLDEDEDDRPAGLAGPAVVNSVVLQPPTADVAAGPADSAGVISPDELTPAATNAPAAFAPPAEPAVVEPDRVRLSEEDTDDDENEATALAVDLGLVFEDEPALPPPAPVAGPADTVDIDLAAAPAAATGTETHPADDVFDADEIDAFLADLDREQRARPPIDAPPADEPPAIAAEADEATPGDAAAAPKGGSLSDLIPSGPPLVGGSFMSLPPMLAPEPPGPRGPGGPGGPKRRPMRVGFGDAPPRRGGAPFAAGRTIADAAGKPADAEDDYSMARADVAGDAFGGGAAIAPEALPAAPIEARAPAAARPRGIIAPILPDPRPAVEDVDVVAATPRVVQTYAPPPSAESEAERVRRHKRRVRRVVACLVGGVVLIGGAAWGVYYFTPLKSTVDALISYDGLDRLGLAEAAEFRVGQNALLLKESTRADAVADLPPAVSAGFLSDGRSLLAAVSDDAKVRWPGEQSTKMRLRVRTTDKQDDVARVRALAEQMVAAGAADREQTKIVKTKLREDESKMALRREEIKSLDDQIQALSQATLGRGSVRDASALNAEFLDAEVAVTSIRGVRQELGATVDRLSKAAIVGAPGDAAGDPTVADAEIEKRTKELNELTQAGTRPALDAGAETRKKLDSLYDSLESDLAKAQNLGNSTPQLTEYVEEAKRSFLQMREMTSSLIRRQETNLARLAEFKAKLADTMLAKAESRVAKDTELKKLKDNQAVVERQRNAAVGANWGNEVVDRANLELRLLNIKIAEREESLRKDAMDNEAIAALDKLIKDIEAESAKDRKSVDEALTALQGRLQRTPPGIEKLPAEQQAVAEAIAKKLAAVNAERQAYAQATEKAQADAARAEAQSRDRVDGLRTEIAALRQQSKLAAEAKQAEASETDRRTKLAAAQTELADARLAEQKAQHRYTDAIAAMDNAEKARKANQQAEADRQTKTAARDAAQRELRIAQDAHKVHTGQIAGLIVPGQVELTTYDDDDRRPALLAGIVGGLVALLLIPLSIDLLGLYRESHEPQYDYEAGEGFEPVLADEAEDRKALPEPASV